MSGVLRCQRGQEFWVFDTIGLCASGSFGCSRGPCTGGIGTPQQDATARAARLLRSQCQTARGIFKCCCALQERMLPKRLKVSYKALLSMFRSRLRTWLQVTSLFFVSFCSAGEYIPTFTVHSSRQKHCQGHLVVQRSFQLAFSTNTSFPRLWLLRRLGRAGTT